MKKKNTGKKLRTFKRSSCPVANTLDILGDRWTLLLVRDLFLGKSTYGEFLQSPEGIPSNILAERLKRLELHGLIVKEPYQERPTRYTYRLSDKGKALAPVMKAVRDWGLKNIPGTDVRMADASRRH